MTAHQSYLEGGINFMDDKGFYKMIKQSKKQEINSILSSYIINDEYDNLFDGLKVQTISEKFYTLQQFVHKLVSFTGSCLTNEEIQCLEYSFNCDYIRFPLLEDKNDNKIQKRRSFIYQQKDIWLKTIPSIVLDIIKDGPAIISLSKVDHKIFCSKLKQINIQYNDLTLLNSKQHFDDLQTTIDKQFSYRNEQGMYGIYIIDEILGRRTDFPLQKKLKKMVEYILFSVMCLTKDQLSKQLQEQEDF